MLRTSSRGSRMPGSRHGILAAARATPRRLGSPRGSPRRRGEDASNQPLQPTLRHEHPRIVRFPGARPSPYRPRGNRESRFRSLRGTTFRMIPTPVHRALDGARRASVDSPTVSLPPPACGGYRAQPFGRRLLGAGFVGPAEAGDRPLTLPVAPRDLVPVGSSPGEPRTAATTSPSRRWLVRSEAPSLEECSPASLSRSPCGWEPATGLAA